ncbi:MAG: XRE family transcriptional regulator [Chlorobi bacterium CHB2]|nr:XRE family transcriptional regulator [Chlorobi bacterium CHB2]
MDTSAYTAEPSIPRRHKTTKQHGSDLYVDMGLLKLALELKRGSRSYQQAAKDAESRVPNIHTSTIYNAENGIVPSLNNYIKLCMWLGVTLDKFVRPELHPLLGVDSARVSSNKVTPMLIDEG